MMRLLAIAIFAMLVGGPTPKPFAAQYPSPPDAAAAAKIKSEVSDALADYVKIVNAHDPKGVAKNAYVVPAFFVMPIVGVLQMHTEDITKGYGNFMQQELSKGWNKMTFDDASVCVLSVTSALASGKTIRYRADGSVIDSAGELFVYIRTKAGWRIAALIGISGPKKVVTCNE